MSDFIHAHQALCWTIAASTALALIAGGIALAILIRLPADYFTKPRPPGRGPWRIVRSVGGWLLILVGLAMLALPGPGTMVLLLGIMSADFPGKHRVQQWILSRGPVLKSANWLRAKFHQPPLKAPSKSQSRGRARGAAHATP
jgi:hypothetical protein